MLKRQRPPNVLEACAGARNIALKMKLGDQAKLSRPEHQNNAHNQRSVPTLGPASHSEPRGWACRHDTWIRVMG